MPANELKWCCREAAPQQCERLIKLNRKSQLIVTKGDFVNYQFTKTFFLTNWMNIFFFFFFPPQLTFKNLRKIYETQLSFFIMTCCISWSWYFWNWVIHAFGLVLQVYYKQRNYWPFVWCVRYISPQLASHVEQVCPAMLKLGCNFFFF